MKAPENIQKQSRRLCIVPFIQYSIPFSGDKVIGLSKVNRIVDYFPCRPQLQEPLTVPIAGELKRILNSEDVAVLIDARHMCVS